MASRAKVMPVVLAAGLGATLLRGFLAPVFTTPQTSSALTMH
eukprot:CAMPEP_0203931058 /NCGR_PEP_ID=MMETSP0359-20131031/69691_1 /ASSEMBLY_ACC=CAM_ASM_000338 /TAXON_ID=268821 /ORGANISM="Scrippsiella Hangoei, Strain SHTV-5" /LENGTH=41 /DNA_ID= /DNA_START= /DNA_END= /DNA_ORIENTATION=